jgi:hypothetical protein
MNNLNLLKEYYQTQNNSIKENVKRNSNWSESDFNYMLKLETPTIIELINKEAQAVERRIQREEEEKEAKRLEKEARWTKAKYNRWIKGMASNGGAEHAYDMAENAKYETGLIAYVRNMIQKDWGSETPLERIQWDIEACS